MTIVSDRSQRQVAASAAAWPAADLEARLTRALDFAALIVADFAHTGYVDEVKPELGFGPEKVVAEAVMLAYAAAGAGVGSGIQERVDALAATLAPLSRSHVARADAALNPQRAFRRAVPHVLLTSLGYPDAGFDELIADRCARVLRLAADQAPTVLAERDWITGIWNRSFPPAQAAGDILERPFDLALDSRDDVYGLTHHLFYLTDFGHAPDVDVDRTRLFADVDSLVARYVAREDYDLTAELLMAWPQLREPWSATATFAFRVLADAEDAVGVLPCGNIDEDRLAVLTGEERTRYARATSYHTAFVWGILCAFALRPGGAPGVAVAGSPFDPDAAHTLWAMTGTDRADWRSVLGRCTASEYSALAPMLADIAVARALPAHDFRTIQRVLASAAHFGLPRTSALAAAEDVLRAVNAAATA